MISACAVTRVPLNTSPTPQSTSPVRETYELRARSRLESAALQTRSSSAPPPGAARSPIPPPVPPTPPPSKRRDAELPHIGLKSPSTPSVSAADDYVERQGLWLPTILIFFMVSGSASGGVGGLLGGGGFHFPIPRNSGAPFPGNNPHVPRGAYPPQAFNPSGSRFTDWSSCSSSGSDRP